MSHKLEILKSLERFAQDLMVMSDKLPADFYLEIGLPPELLNQFHNEMDKKYEHLFIYTAETGVLRDKRPVFNSWFSPEMGHLFIKGLKK
jgi:hypothetical protein